jgi:Cu/Zn superoxide dismutase
MRRHPQVLTTGPRGDDLRSARFATSGRRARTVLRDFRCAAQLALLAGLLASCASDDTGTKKSQPAPIIGAQLRPMNGSNATGLVTFEATAGGLKANATLYAGRQGKWRIVIHTTGVCTSPNGFSAGPPLIVPGATEPPTIVMTTTEDGIAIETVRLPGLTLDGPAGITGKSVVAHYGTAGSLEAQPGVPNNRAACGVIGTIKPLGLGF